MDGVSTPALRLSVVAAVLDEAENIRPVVSEIARALVALRPFEVIFVDEPDPEVTPLGATRFANGLRERLLRDGCPDTGAPMKLFARDAFLRLPQFEGLHRFLPALLASYGHPLLCKPVRHRARLHGSSKYTNWNRAVVGLRDMVGVMWLQKRTVRPERVTEV